MKNKITLTALILATLSIGFIGGSYAPINKNLVELQSLKQGLFIIHKGELYTVSKLVTDTDSYQKMERIK
jgi:hypothetical protein